MFRLFFFLYCSRTHRDLHSFPTRRSSDLSARTASQSANVRPSISATRNTYCSPLRSLRHKSATESAGDLWRKLRDRKSTRLNSSHVRISYAVFCLKKKKKNNTETITTNTT